MLSRFAGYKFCREILRLILWTRLTALALPSIRHFGASGSTRSQRSVSDRCHFEFYESIDRSCKSIESATTIGRLATWRLHHVALRDAAPLRTPSRSRNGRKVRNVPLGYLEAVVVVAQTNGLSRAHESAVTA